MPAQTDQIAVVRNGTQQMNGMNLGGWLVIEQFLAPEMYKNASKTVPWGPNPAGYGVYGERQIALDAAQQDANDTTGTMNVVGRWRQAIFNHRDTFVTEADFALLASAGINTVRLPVGFWLFAQSPVRPPPAKHCKKPLHGHRLCRSVQQLRPPTAVDSSTHLFYMCTQTDAYPFVEGAYQYVDLAMQWAAKYGIAVWLGVHAVNGSQNGYEASAPEIARTEIWDSAPKGSDPTYQNQSLTFVTQLCQRYGSSPALVAVSLMNEPTVRGSDAFPRRL